jgi:serine/threonine-protein kinase
MNDSFKLAPGEWSALRRLLDQALDLPTTDRAAWLDALGPDDAPFRSRLQALLVHAGDVPAKETIARLLDTLPQVETAQFAPEPRDDALALEATVGPYRLLRRLGEGGMGDVWLAERTDLLQQRQVALKLPRLVTGRARLAERLAREREILATLEHPNIARLYDAGVGADGQPWLALEYVEGERIDTWCARKRLDVPARLRLFLQVARAVAHAHARLVIHRDLKPANILVTEAGEARLLDFGIAKLLEDGRAQETELTQLAGRALTPDYAAPEQIAGQPVGTAADIYALGVVLFELLTGSRPYKLKRDSRAALEEAIAQAEVQRPSSVVADAKLRRRLRGDLDTIVLKALKRAPAERYGTVEALADDIERHLDQRPVRAQRDAPGYRLRKFVARNRLAVGAAGVASLALLVGAGLALWQARVALDERQRAEEVKNFIASVFQRADPYRGGLASTRAVDLLKQASGRIDEIPAHRVATRVELLTLLGDTLLLLQDTAGGEPVVARALDEAMRGLGPEHPLTVQARLLNLQVHRWRGRAREMRAELDALIPLLRRLGPPRDLAIGLQYLSHAALDEGRFDEAEAAAREGLALARTALGELHNNTVQLAMMLAQTYQYGAPRPTLAVQAAEEAMTLVLKARAPETMHPQITDMRHILGRAYSGAGQPLRAVQELQRAAEEAEVQVGPAGRKLAFIRSNLARAQRRAGQLEAALPNHDMSLAVFTEQFKPESVQPALALSSRGATRLLLRDAAAAERDLGTAAGWLALAQGEQHVNTLIARAQHAHARALQGDVAGAVAALRALDDASGPGPARATIAHTLGIALRLQGDATGAIAAQRRALELYGDGPDTALDRAHARTEIALAQLDLGQAAAALAQAEEALPQFAALQSEPTPARADALLAQGRALLAGGRFDEAVGPLQAATAYWRARDSRPAQTSDTAVRRWRTESASWLARAKAAVGRGGKSPAPAPDPALASARVSSEPRVDPAAGRR